MAEHTNQANDRSRTPDEKSFNRAPKVFSKATLAVAIVALVFVIVAAVLLSGIFSAGGR